MRLVPIPKDKYEAYRLNLMFDCYKWDPQFSDYNTIARYALVITQEEHEELANLTEKLDTETRAAEVFLNNHFRMTKPLALPKSVIKEIKKMGNYRPEEHVRLMRYDFHPTTEGKWAVSEVNSDVPGGFAEASFMPALALELLEGKDCWYRNFGDILVNAIQKKVVPQGRIMLVHCTSYSDDRQVMQFLGDRLKERGFSVIYAAADHLKFEAQKAVSILDGNEGRVDAIFRFTPLEWLTEIKPKRWQGYFDTTTLSCNHPIAIYAQTKRFPLVWDALEHNGVSMSTFRELLPETVEVKAAKGKEGYIYKPACGRVGENISIREACTGDEYQKIIADVKRHPQKYLAQKRFDSKPLTGEGQELFHVCLGSYTVDGEHAGYYARISKSPRIDSRAADIPVLIEGKGGSHDK
ncbi:MAG: glutathionylspermidine synthase [Lachnospiraceae bacterium]|nr:glutathionylspermidine synthase [Lachnospiraceae bacterium]